MKIPDWLIFNSTTSNFCRVFAVFALLICGATNANAQVTQNDQVIFKEIVSQLVSKETPQLLYYPNAVKRLYQQTGNQLIWIKPDTVKTHAADALMLLDCVLLYGLNHADYHPRVLLYETLHQLTAQFDKVSAKEKVRYDLLLTDAMITLVNHLHFGKLNPLFTPAKIDRSLVGFQATAILQEALISADFAESMLSVQPKTQAYIDLQTHTKLLKGQLSSDCFVVPEVDIRKMAINMERLRWAEPIASTYIQINIPSQMLLFHQGDAVQKFRVIGRKSKPSISGLPKTLSGNDHVVPSKAQAKDLYSAVKKDYNRGNLKFEYAEKLASLLQQHRAFSNKPVPVVITYFTCDVQDYGLVTYKDVYNLDGKLEAALYKTGKLLK
ncbi:MAG: hypothetical protein ACOH2A_01810 [Sphingobacteriaceae bacterium]